MELEGPPEARRSGIPSWSKSATTTFRRLGRPASEGPGTKRGGPNCGADRDNPNGYYEFEPVKRTREDGSWVDSAGGLVVKMVYMLLADLPAGPEYRIVLMRRDLDEMVASQKRMLERLGRPAGALSDAKRIAMFATHLQRIERELPSRPGFSLLTVDYNQLLADAGIGLSGCRVRFRPVEQRGDRVDVGCDLGPIVFVPQRNR